MMSIMTVPFYILIDCHKGFQFPHILLNTCHRLTLYSSHPMCVSILRTFKMSFFSLNYKFLKASIVSILFTAISFILHSVFRTQYRFSKCVLNIRRKGAQHSFSTLRTLLLYDESESSISGKAISYQGQDEIRSDLPLWMYS